MPDQVGHDKASNPEAISAFQISLKTEKARSIAGMTRLFE